MSQIWKIVKWEFMNRVRTKLFLITTFLLPFFMGAMMYLPTILMDLEPEDGTNIGLVYDNEIDLLMERFQQQCDVSLLLQNGEPQFSFTRMFSEKEALDSVLSQQLDGYMIVPTTVLDTGQVRYFSQSLSNIKIYTSLRRTLNQLVIQQRMLDQNIDISLEIGDKRPYFASNKISFCENIKDIDSETGDFLTGFEENLIKKYSKHIPILKAGNMSLGINLLMYLTS